jgi:hypothetical protein
VTAAELAIPSPHGRPRSSFARSAFRRLFLSHTVSVRGDRLVPVALAFAVLDISASVSDLGVATSGSALRAVGAGCCSRSSSPGFPTRRARSLSVLGPVVSDASLGGSTA